MRLQGWTRTLSVWLTAGLLTGCSMFIIEEEEEIPALAPPAPVERPVHQVRRGDIIERVTLRARVVPAQVQEHYFLQHGRTQAVHVRVGQEVKAGDLLIERHVGDAAYQADQARIRLRKAELALDDARYRAQFMRAGEAEREILRYQLDVDSARLELERWEREVAGSRLYAKIDGRVMSLNARAGEESGPYQVLITLADPSQLLIEADLDDEAVSVGQVVELDFTGLTGRGEIVEVIRPTSNTAVPGARPKVLVQADGVQSLAIGAVGRIHVIGQERQDVLLLPNVAIREFGARTYVIMESPRREVDVRLGIRGELESEVLEGLSEGDRVIGR